MNPTVVAPESVGLTREEYKEICRRLGREPTALELRLFGVMWSEHCGYKHSRQTLQSLPSDSPYLLQGPGENAGVLDVGSGWAVAFKMESHNHPSAVDPFNGAATGVGGIIRDILSMGARPIALLDSLRFGPLDDAKSRRIANGVISGIAGYGNCVGVPTVAGEIAVDDAYRNTPLVNVACLGLVRHDRVARARARGSGNPVVYVGAWTGRDGIGGAAFASEELDERSEHDDRSSVQLGDPFTGKLLIEATLEALQTGQVVAIQDMGAAGLTCAASEMAAQGGVGMRINLDAVPLRESSMHADEILRSESQERMLLVVSRGAESQVAEIFHRWGLAVAVIGEVVSDAVLEFAYRGTVVASLPPYTLAEAPTYRPSAREPVSLQDRWNLKYELPQPDPHEAMRRMVAAPDVASKRPVFEQYDHMVQVRTVVAPGAADAAVLRLQEVQPRGVALTADGNGRVCGLDPYRGAKLAVAEAAANLACVGALPLGVTDCLNFGNPEDPEVFWTFRQAVAGIADACRGLRIPVVGGNVSFYNESPDGPVLPTPVVAMVGLIEDVARTATMAFRGPDELIVLVGGLLPALDASTYLRVIHGLARGRPADVDLDLHSRIVALVRGAIVRGWIHSAHDCSDGGIAVALAECTLGGGIGAEVTLPYGMRPDVALFGEAPSRIVVSLPEAEQHHFLGLAREYGVPSFILGRTGGDRLRIVTSGEHSSRWAVDMSLSDLSAAYQALTEIFA